MKINAFFEPAIVATETHEEQSRTVSGLLLPFEEIGYTSGGPLVAMAGTIRFPDNVGDVVLNIEHDFRQLVGNAIALDEADDGIRATFEFAKTRAGDDACEEVRAGLRRCLSVELDEVTVNDAGQITDALITGAGLVLRPAFASAKLAASKAEDISTEEAVGEETNNKEKDDQTMQVTIEEATEATAARVPAGLPTTLTASKKTLDALSGAFAQANRNESRQVMAALADIIPSNWYATDIPGYIGELWSGKAYQRRVIPRFGRADLKARKISGWRWTKRPEVQLYEGNKAAIPSDTIATEEVIIEAQRIAGGHDIDRVFVDFENPEFWASYWRAMTESYARLSDATTLAQLTSDAPKVTADPVPDSIAPAFSYIIDGIVSVLNETDTLPDTAFIATDLWKQLMLTPHDQRLAYLDAALGFEEGKLADRNFAIIPESRIDSTSVLVTTREAVTVHEFGGGAPIRVQALNIANGGIDAAVFGYLANNTHDAGGLALVKATHEA